MNDGNGSKLFDNLYSNIGGKIKSLAKAAFIVEAIASVITGIVLIAIGDDTGPLGDAGLFISVFAGLLTIVLGILAAWASSWLIYGFGEIVDKVCDIERNTRGLKRKSEDQSKLVMKELSKLKHYDFKD